METSTASPTPTLPLERDVSFTFRIYPLLFASLGLLVCSVSMYAGTHKW